MNTPKLETGRLVLRCISCEDIDVIYNCWIQNEDIFKHMLWKANCDKKQTEEFVQFELGNISSDTWFRWIIELKEKNK